MSRRARARGGRGHDGARSGGIAIEPPLAIPDLAAWFDPRVFSSFTLVTGAVSSWSSRAGSLGAIPFSQGTPAYRPIYIASTPELNNLPSVQFGAHILSSSAPNSWRFTYDGSGFTRFDVLRVDSTGGATQRPWGSADAANEVGSHTNLLVGALNFRVFNGTGTTVHAANPGAAFAPRDLTYWLAASFGNHSSSHYVAGQPPFTASDSQAPSSANPTRGFTMGGGNGPVALKALFGQSLWYSRVLSPAEVGTLGQWAASLYGIAA